MAKKRTEKNRYPSRYSPKSYVHAAQYITELICEKKAKVEQDKDDKGKIKELPLKFWESSKEWLKFYKYQIMLANRLIKEFGEHSVIAALHDTRMYKTYSLRSPFLKNIIKEYVKKEEVAKKIMQSKTIDVNRSDNKTFGNKTSKKNVISKLKGLE